MSAFAPGSTFGDYRVVRMLGAGASGEVWLLESGRSGLKAAAKILSPELAKVHEHRIRFVREAATAMEIRHPNLVRVYDVGEDPETELCYMLMEYASGGTLAERIAREGALPVAEALRIVRALASLVEVVSSRGIVHRDIKPGNILFGGDGEPKLSDLGIARFAGGSAEEGVPAAAAMVGTLAYMAPEQMLDPLTVDVRADIYSLGVVLFEMLAGRRPSNGSDVVRVVAERIGGDAVPDVREFRPDASEAVANLVRLMCAADPEGRVRSPRALLSLVDWAERGAA